MVGRTPGEAGNAPAQPSLHADPQSWILEKVGVGSYLYMYIYDQQWGFRLDVPSLNLILLADAEGVRRGDCGR